MKMKSLLWCVVFICAISYATHAAPPPAFEKRVLSRALSPAEERQQHLILLSVQASQASYQLPNLRIYKGLEDYVGRFETFLSTIPPGYVVYGADAEIESGLKYVILKPSTTGDPWILAFTGTNSLIDALADTGLGSAQFEQLKEMILLFSLIPQLSDVDLLVTGHSLGGGLAQAAAHEIQRQRDAQGNPAKVILRTWNAFGSQELIERVSGGCDSRLLERLDAANYNVRGDLVSRIGTHFGPTYELAALDISSHPGDPLYLHSLDTIEDHVKKLIHTQPLVVRPVTLVSGDKLNMLSKVVGLVGTLGNQAIHGFRQLRIVQQQLVIIRQVQASDFQEPVRADALRYLYNVGVREQHRLAQSSDSDRHKYAVVLKAQLERIRPWLGSVISTVDSQ